MIETYTREIVISAYNEIRELSGFLQAEILSMWRAYFDESGHESDPKAKILAIAGCVAESDPWLNLIPQWYRVLDNFNVKAFHAYDFAQTKNDFQGWSEAQRQDFLNALLALIDNSRLRVIASAILLDDYRPLTKEAKQHQGSAYHILFQKCLIDVGKLDCFSGNDKVAVMFEDNDEFSGKALELWKDAKKADFWKDYGHRFQVVAFSPKSFAPLQVADLMAYETNKYVKLQYGYDTKQRGSRYPFNRIIDGTQFDRISIFDRDVLTDLFAYYGIEAYEE
jgi:hypothetical protein